jgi:hypothetical protein
MSCRMELWGVTKRSLPIHVNGGESCRTGLPTCQVALDMSHYALDRFQGIADYTAFSDVGNLRVRNAA